MFDKVEKGVYTDKDMDRIYKKVKDAQKYRRQGEDFKKLTDKARDIIAPRFKKQRAGLSITLQVARKLLGK